MMENGLGLAEFHRMVEVWSERGVDGLSDLLESGEASPEDLLAAGLSVLYRMDGLFREVWDTRGPEWKKVDFLGTVALRMGARHAETTRELEAVKEELRKAMDLLGEGDDD